jgi:hypothetical protein
MAMSLAPFRIVSHARGFAAQTQKARSEERALRVFMPAIT